MASRNPRAPIPVPLAGVRRDLDTLSIPEGALEVGENVIVRKGVLTPRAAHSGLGWFFDGEWEPLYASEFVNAIAYDSGNTRFLVALSDGTIAETTDEFDTVTLYSGTDVPDGVVVGLVFDLTNQVWIAVTDEGSLWTVPDTWPGAGSWTERVTGDSGATPQVLHDLATGRTGALIAPSGFPTSYYVYFSSDGTTWEYETYYPGTNPYAATSIPFFGSEVSTGKHLFGFRRTGDAAGNPSGTDYVATRVWGSLNKPTGWPTPKEVDSTLTSLASGSGTDLLVAISDDGAEIIVEKSDDRGATWATELGSGLAYNPRRYTRLFYDDTLGWLVIGEDPHRSADAATWDQYQPPPFDPEGVIGAVSDGTDWFVASDTGIWKFPTVELADAETIVSMYQMDTDDVVNQVFVSTDQAIRMLDASTGELTELDLEVGPPAVEFDISSEPRGLRTVFRSFECIPPDTLPGGTDYKHVLLMTNPDLDLSYWYSSESGGPEVHYCDYGSAVASKVLLTCANRVIIANGPAGSVHGVDASDDVGIPGNLASGWDGLNLVILADTPGEITAGMELGALQFAMFKEDCVYHGIHQGEFAGVGTAFRFEMIKTGIQGPVSPHSLLRTPSGALCYLGQDGGVYLYDGSPQDLGVHVRRLIAGQMDFDNRHHAWGFVDAIERLVHFFFPTVAGNMNRGVTVDLDSGAAWEIKLPSWFNAAAGGPMFITKDLTWGDFMVPWSDMTAAWNSFQSGYYYVALGSESNLWGYQDWNDIPSYTDFGTPITVAWKPGWFPLGNPDAYATLLEIRHRMGLFADGQTLSCVAYALDSEFDLETVKDDGSTLTSETGEYTTEHDLSGMLFSYQMSGAITRRFVWGGGLARFRQRGEA